MLVIPPSDFGCSSCSSPALCALRKNSRRNLISAEFKNLRMLRRIRTNKITASRSRIPITTVIIYLSLICIFPFSALLFHMFFISKNHRNRDVTISRMFALLFRCYDDSETAVFRIKHYTTFIKKLMEHFRFAEKLIRKKECAKAHSRSLLFHFPNNLITIFFRCRSSMKIRSQASRLFQYLIHCLSDLCCALPLS